MAFREIVFLVAVYSFLGWCVEVIYHTVKYGEFSNRGFVGGPVCTIYGVGFTGIVILLNPFRNNALVLFAVSVVLTTALEFVTGWVLEKVFHEKWWDYSKEPFNIRGYICVRFSLIWGLACTATMIIVHPLIEKVYGMIPGKVCVVFLIVAATLYVTDWCVTVLEIRKIRIRIRIAKSVADLMDDVSDFIGTGLHEGTISAMEKGADGKEMLADMHDAWVEKREAMELSLSENRAMFLGRLEYERDRLKKNFEENREEKNRKAKRRRAKLLRRVNRLKNRYLNLVGKTTHTERRLSHAFPALHIPKEGNVSEENLKDAKKNGSGKGEGKISGESNGNEGPRESHGEE